MKTPGQPIQRGFTLVEISIVLVIIGAIFYSLLHTQVLISSSKAKDVVAKITDIRTAVAYFQQRYSYLPGDLPTPANFINATPALVAGTGGVNGNGSIEGAVTAAGLAAAGSEAAQAPWQLFSAGLIGTVNSATPTNYLNTTYGPIQLVSAATANGLVPGFAAANPSARNAILFFNLPCDVATEVDSKIDDGVITTGTARASAACVGTNAVAVYAVTL
ncbi:prepilin-type N-terminal cleavage/methylation domain-containing protein [Oxalobacteraceae bacterium GrIS 1.18]